MPNVPKKYIFSANSYSSLYNFRKEIIEKYLSEGITVYLLAPVDTKYTEYFTQLGCICLFLKMSGKGKNPLSELNLFFQYWKTYKKVGPNIIFHYTIKPNIYGNIAAALLRIPSFVFITGLGSAFIDNKLTTKIVLLLYKVSFPYAKKILVLNQDDFDLIKEKIPKVAPKLYLLPGEGLNIDRYHPTTQCHSSYITFLMIARAIKQKGIIEYIEAARELRSIFPNVQFAFMGELDSDNSSAISTEEFKLWEEEGIIDYWGYDKDIQQYIEKADCIVLPSYREGLPIALLEALAMKKPIITTDAPGCKDVVKNGLNGYICASRSIESLVFAIRKMISLSKEERITMGEFGRKQVESNYSIGTIWGHYKKIEGETLTNG